MRLRGRAVEWPTVALVIANYALWGAATAFATDLGPVIAFALIALTASFHASLTHEVCHGHPTRRVWLNDLMVAPAISLFVPHDRYRATHLAHHHDPTLTDPYDDPESNYFDPTVWRRLPRPFRLLMRLNNTLFGRLAVGPLISTVCFYRSEIRLMLAGDSGTIRGWLKHVPSVGVVVLWLATVGEVPAFLYLGAAYAGLSLQKIRSYLEHRAHPQARGRTVIVEDRGPLAWLFLNNNLHAVHHAHPRLPWYDLPAVYRDRRASFLGRNGGYRYSGYGEVFRNFLLRAKDPVPHPLMPGDEPAASARDAGVVLSVPLPRNGASLAG